MLRPLLLLCACASAKIGTTSRAAPVRPLSSDEPKQSWRQQLNDALPHVQVRIAPLTHLKVRKNVEWLRTRLSIGADYSTQRGLWKLQYAWEDTFIGGRMVLKGTELQLHKAWVLTLGTAANLAATLRLRAALDLRNMRTSCRFGFRTESQGAINIVDGVDLVKRLPLDGQDGHAKLEVKLRVAFPQPDLNVENFGDEGNVYVGMGELEIDVDEMNLCLDW